MNKKVTQSQETNKNTQIGKSYFRRIVLPLLLLFIIFHVFMDILKSNPYYKLNNLPKKQLISIGHQINYIYKNVKILPLVCTKEGKKMNVYQQKFAAYYQNNIADLETFLTKNNSSIEKIEQDLIDKSVQEQLIIQVYEDLFKIKELFKQGLLGPDLSEEPSSVADICRYLEENSEEFFANTDKTNAFNIYHLD